MSERQTEWVQVVGAIKDSVSRALRVQTKCDCKAEQMGWASPGGGGSWTEKVQWTVSAPILYYGSSSAPSSSAASDQQQQQLGTQYLCSLEDTMRIWKSVVSQWSASSKLLLEYEHIPKIDGSVVIVAQFTDQTKKQTRHDLLKLVWGAALAALLWLSYDPWKWSQVLTNWVLPSLPQS